MAIITEQELKAQIRSKEFSNLYFLYGEEIFLAQTYVKKIVSAVVPKGMDSFNLHTFNGRECTMQEVAEAAEALPLMCERKCVVLCDFNAESARAAELDIVKELVADPPEQCVLIFWFDSVEVDAKKSAKWRALIKAAEKSGAVCELTRRSRRELAKMLVDSASKRGCRLSENHAYSIIDIAGDDLQILHTEIQKLCACADGGEITSDMIESLVSKTVEANVFDLVKAIVNRNSTYAYNLLDGLFYNRVDPIQIMGAVVMGYADMYRAKAAISSGGRAEDAAQYYNYKNKEFRLRNAAREASKISVRSLRESIFILNEADSQLKGSAVNGRIVLETMVARLLIAAEKD